MKMSDQVKYQMERAEDALRTALKFADKESVYVISAISKALIEIDNSLFAERIEAAVKEGNTAAQGLISIDKEEEDTQPYKYSISKELTENGSVQYNMHEMPYRYYGVDDGSL